MKKFVYYLIFLLALVLMVLCSSACRSPKTMTYSKASTDSVNLSVKDSSDLRFEFTFDSLELWSDSRIYGDSDSRIYGTTDIRTSQAQPSSVNPSFRNSVIPHLRTAALGSSVNPSFRSSVIPNHAVIYGGKLTANITRDVSHDSIHNKSSTQAQRSEVPNFRFSVIPYGIAIAIAILLIFFFYKKRKGCAKI